MVGKTVFKFKNCYDFGSFPSLLKCGKFGLVEERRIIRSPGFTYYL